MRSLTVRLTDAQFKALAWAVLDPAFFVQSDFEGRADKAKAELVAEEIERLRAAGAPIPASDDEIVLAAPVKTARERAAMPQPLPQP